MMMLEEIHHGFSEHKVTNLMRKLGRLTLFGFLALLGLGCSRAMLTAISPVAHPGSLRGVKVALVEFPSLPPDYPIRAKPFFPSLTGELYEEDTRIRRPNPTAIGGGLTPGEVEEIVAMRTFVPRDHQTILNDTILLAMGQKGFFVELSPSAAAASRAGATLIVMGVVKKFKIERVGEGKDFRGLSTNAKAEVRVLVGLFSGLTGAPVWEGELQSTVTHTELYTQALQAKGANVLHVLRLNESPYHGFRSLLAMASYNIASQLAERLETIALTGAPGQ